MTSLTGEAPGGIPRPPIHELDGAVFDVAVIGAGVNGCSAAQHLAAAGYDVLLVDKADIAAGASGRSSRLLHCGLRYLAPGRSLWEFLRYPERFVTACRMARQAMISRSQFVKQTPERVRSFNFYYPVYATSPYKPWQVDMAFRLLALLGPKDVPLDYRRLSVDEVRRTPLAKWLREPDALRAVAAFREYQFEWPERIAVDTAMDAARLGAVVRTYTAASRIERAADEFWRIRLRDTLGGDGEATVSARLVVNTAGAWIDQVNRSAKPDAPRRITGTKGVHIMVRLPAECQGHGIATVHRENQPFYCVPWRGLHYFGPTETLFEGDPDSVRPTEAEIAWLLAEANHLLPHLGLTQDDVIFAWAGVRPLTYDPDQPMGSRSRELHDLDAAGLPGILALTAGPIMTHRSAGPMVAEAVQGRLRPSRTPQSPSYAAPLSDPDTDARPINDAAGITTSELRAAASAEQPGDLYDLFFRRIGIGWTASMGDDVAEDAARAIADIMQWDEREMRRQVARFRERLRDDHFVRGTRRHHET